MNTTRRNTPVRLAVASAVLTGAAVLAAGPVYAGPAPDPVAAAGTTGSVTASAQKLDGIERAAQEHEAVPQQSPSNNPGSDPSSVPVIVLALLGGGLVTVAAETTVLRFRHRGAIGAATA